ncbi:MAG: hypothetical protein GY906_22395 [bacterium]|nr:hypothetical protein [bacterium]
MTATLDLIFHIGSIIVMMIAGGLAVKYGLNGLKKDVRSLRADQLQVKEDARAMKDDIHKIDKRLAVIVATCPICRDAWSDSDDG